MQETEERPDRRETARDGSPGEFLLREMSEKAPQRVAVDAGPVPLVLLKVDREKFCELVEITPVGGYRVRAELSAAFQLAQKLSDGRLPTRARVHPAKLPCPHAHAQ